MFLYIDNKLLDLNFSPEEWYGTSERKIDSHRRNKLTHFYFIIHSSSSVVWIQNGLKQVTVRTEGRLIRRGLLRKRREPKYWSYRTPGPLFTIFPFFWIICRSSKIFGFNKIHEIIQTNQIKVLLGSFDHKNPDKVLLLSPSLPKPVHESQSVNYSLNTNHVLKGFGYKTVSGGLTFTVFPSLKFVDKQKTKTKKGTITNIMTIVYHP